jgi:carbonyl reductase 1
MITDSETDANVVKGTLHTNYYGSLAMTQDILPLIRPGGRLVNLCSMSGHLSKYSSTLKEAFISASKKSVPACTALMEKFTRDVEAGKEKAEGWPSAAYAVSKAGEIAFTKVIAQEEEKKGRGVLINACCPGYVNTDMSKGNGTKTVDQGAKTPVLLALGEINGTTGGFWQSERIIEW